MPKYTATLGFSVQCYSTIEFEAYDDEAAKTFALKACEEPEAWDVAYDTADDHRVVSISMGEEPDEEVIAEDLYPEASPLGPHDGSDEEDEEPESIHAVWAEVRESLDAEFGPLPEGDDAADPSH